MIFSLPSMTQRRAVIIIFDMISVFLAYYFSFALRYESFTITDYEFPLFATNLLLNSGLQIITILAMGIHRGLWRFASTSDLILIIKSVAIALFVSFTGTFLFDRLEFTPRSVYLIDGLLLIIFLSGGRFAYRMFKQSRKVLHAERAIIVGAGVAGEQLIREFKKNPNQTKYDIACIVDDSPEKIGRTIHGIKVFGPVDNLPDKVKKYDAGHVLIAIPSATNKTIGRIYELTKDLNVKVNTLPPIMDLMSGKVSFTQMREVSVEDLMGRSVANLDIDQIAHKHSEKVILVTGGGGSIGSELCRQIIKYNPQTLLIVDNSEFNSYRLGEELLGLSLTCKVVFYTADVTDLPHMDSIFEKHRPNIIYHAAAYKHVPLMELNPHAAIKTNVAGTNLIAEMALKYNADQFILISTDKAVNPTNVMGTTKRIAEMICEFHQGRGETKFSMVRFGNVLGSSGSVIPKFKKQILAGGPVTVTHPEITRYFMSIPEAAQLVIQAGCLSNGGEIHVLDMGKPVKITDLAKELITLSGFEVGSEIKIEFSGLRPGEKLYEELLADNEATLPTSHKMVRVAKARALPQNFEDQLKNLLTLSFSPSKDEIKSLLNKLVSEYTPDYEQNIIPSELS